MARPKRPNRRNEAKNIGKESNSREKRQRHLRNLIIGALSAGGVFQLNSWQAQACGNRSSHSVSSVQHPVLGPDDYVLMRQSLTAPNSPDTAKLATLNAQVQMKSVQGFDVLRSGEFASLVASQKQLQRELQLEPLSEQVLAFLKKGDIPGAVATIEGSGEPDHVLENYTWVLLDLANLDYNGKTQMSTHHEQFATISKAASSYAERVLKAMPSTNLSPVDIALKVRAAEVFHNIASFMIPDQGNISSQDKQLGLNAALEALQIREELHQPNETMIANWMVGKYYYREGDLKQAKQYLTASIEEATRLKSLEGLAWGKVYLARVVQGEDPSEAKSLMKQANEASQASKNAFLMAFLRRDQRQNNF